MIQLLANQDGILLRRDAIAAGADDKALSRAVRSGHLIRLRQGAYVVHPVWAQADPVDRHRLLATAVRQQYGDGVALSHVSACIEQGGPHWGLNLATAHVTHLDGTGGRRLARVIHHHGRCLVDDVTRDAAGWITSPTRTALDTASGASRDAAVAVLDWYLNSGLTTVDDLAVGFRRMTSWPRTLLLQLALRLADSSAESVGETRTRLLCLDEHLPPPTTQLEVRHPSGRLAGRIDFAWPQHRTMLEFDGREKYHRFRRPGEGLEEMVMREKGREDEIRELTGWTMIRLTWADLDRPHATSERIRRAFRASSGVGRN
ncbi:type IV toxin-antitoxin system AbiEi family antitoxin domain-containing protein [Pimelobacter simplex]|uniref:Type IV toxin-antitoxin system AbiEi family antitoxin domain-containing protein n=1 Tax=Nocardioides simplex TaxID=2045 RepID=A0A7J5DYY8_NOCSI|nr:type IV toxin-antitoxin system AbiEi family antitoxin domain-containing protein [Pimelobacter simplex]KAB2811252.1 type IV toxin-antitoxin system AbiEi family antitoxin domain-containing protein [Pimelobacter simplex]